jgi:hypothetical protein
VRAHVATWSAVCSCSHVRLGAARCLLATPPCCVQIMPRTRTHLLHASPSTRPRSCPKLHLHAPHMHTSIRRHHTFVRACCCTHARAALQAHTARLGLPHACMCVAAQPSGAQLVTPPSLLTAAARHTLHNTTRLPLPCVLRCVWRPPLPQRHTHTHTHTRTRMRAWQQASKPDSAGSTRHLFQRCGAVLRALCAVCVAVCCCAAACVQEVCTLSAASWARADTS